MTLLKIILASLIMTGDPVIKKECPNEYDLINYLACETNEYALVDEQFLSWEDWGYDSYNKLNPKNKNFGGKLEKFDLDNLFNEERKRLIEEILLSSNPTKVDLESINFKHKLNKAKGLVPKKTIYSYSYPILINEIDQELYGIILEEVTFELNSEINLKLYVKRSDSWELVYEILIAFS